MFGEGQEQEDREGRREGQDTGRERPEETFTKSVLYLDIHNERCNRCNLQKKNPSMYRLNVKIIINYRRRKSTSVLLSLKGRNNDRKQCEEELYSFSKSASILSSHCFTTSFSNPFIA